MDALADLLIRIRAATTAAELWPLLEEAKRDEQRAAYAYGYAAEKLELVPTEPVVRVEIPL